jgi:hypothetical protein
LVNTAVALLIFAAYCGCGGGKTAPVDGRVKFKDGSDVSVLGGYQISFEPADGKASSVGEIKADGTFDLTTFSAGDGALPGKNRVAITPAISPDPDKPPMKSKLPVKYEDYSRSELVVEIKAGARNVVELELERVP